MNKQIDRGTATCVVARSGLGKTYWAQDYAAQQVIAGELVIALDHGFSWHDWSFRMNGLVLSLAEDTLYASRSEQIGGIEDIDAAARRGHGRTPLAVEFEGAYLRRGGIETRMAPLRRWLQRRAKPITLIVDEVVQLGQYEDAVAQILTAVEWAPCNLVMLAQDSRDGAWLRQYVPKIEVVSLSNVRAA
ncbi:hypothetical protein [Burkholderia cepacia]|uniref:hypothetical protein n=1 Tax=Burkholderia cepacia TaxID=292 RepID=UPI002AB7AD26|nr:hypothetical protein [Burkholderia cepacia]